MPFFPFALVAFQHLSKDLQMALAGEVPKLLLNRDVYICTPDWHATFNSFSLDSSHYSEVSVIFDAMEGDMLSIFIGTHWWYLLQFQNAIFFFFSFLSLTFTNIKQKLNILWLLNGWISNIPQWFWGTRPLVKQAFASIYLCWDIIHVKRTSAASLT